jgi:NAD(P)-dependent dehydrogenase (short-subunit alcohol dehydrogenase family)
MVAASKGAAEKAARRVALVTGGARRVGRQLVLDLAAAGFDVAIHYRTSADEAEATAAGARERGARVALVQGDLADPGVPERLFAAVERELGSVDVLVNNASVFESGSVADTAVADWDRHQSVNLRAPFLLVRRFVAGLPGDREGVVVNLNDWRALRPGADHFAYTISKVGLHGLTRSLAVSLAPRIRVNELALGAILPPESGTEDYVHTLREEIPLRRFGALESVGAALLYLVGARDVTGQTLLVDGGRHLV